MKFSSANRRCLVPVLLALGPAHSLWAQNDPLGDSSGWFARAGAEARFNIKTSLIANNPVAGAGIYNDGFVLQDAGGSASGKTWNWGYNSAGQVAGDNLLLHRYDNVPAAGVRDLNGANPLVGGEIVGGYQFPGFTWLNKPVRVAIEMAYGYAQSSLNMGFGSAGVVNFTSDRYGMNGVIAPQPPYAGTATGPGPLLDLNPNGHTLVSSAATTAFAGRVDTDFQNLRLGPSFEMELTPRFSVAAGIGYSSVYVDSKFNYNEATTFANAAVPPLNSGAVSLKHAEWEPGAYLELRANYQFTQLIGAFCGGDLQYNHSFEFGDAAHQIKVDLGTTYAIKGGVSFRF